MPTIHRHWADLPDDIPGTKQQAPKPQPTPQPLKPAAEKLLEDLLACIKVLDGRCDAQDKVIARLQADRDTLLREVTQLKAAVAPKQPAPKSTLDLMRESIEFQKHCDETFRKHEADKREWEKRFIRSPIRLGDLKSVGPVYITPADPGQPVGRVIFNGSSQS